ncbi:MAG: hypothetical protein D6775_10780 [Caldilineae bacterium]|nr:MAG: hypothetical protein D6775_10780 [Caldilineae bacterium]
MPLFEKLGAFYLGKEYDLGTGQRRDSLIMYDARDLTTHAVCVGMTGSGKTGLCIDLLEEAAIDHVPAIIIDPKGDMTNLLLTFPELRPQDFEPWVNVDDARRKDMSVPEYAQRIAEVWRNGLAEWGEGPDRIRMLKESAEFRIYTPGSDAGLPISILASLRAPALDWDEHQEELREQIQGTVSALLGLVDIEADPLHSREHILLSTIFEHFWRQGEDLDLARLIISIQTPPIRKLGVFDIDTYFPEKDRFTLAMTLNNIMAAPSFSAWLQGEPLDIARLLFTDRGKPRHSVFYIAHLSESERMFFVTLLLEQVITWMRQQPGTTSLRALLYMDEVFGFFPPVANPPSKKPLLTLMKQARAYGLGVVLTTQNPVDIDYKGLSNAGTWFIGKLQTEQDKARVLDGLESASSEAGSALNRRSLDALISRLDSRVFLLHNVHEKEPVVFQTRWAMSYLRGPLTRTQVRQLMEPVKTVAPAPAAAASVAGPAVARDVAAAVTAAPEQTLPEGYSSTPPALPPDLPQVYIPLRKSPHRALDTLEQELKQRVEAEDSRLVYEPGLLAMGSVSFVDRKRKVNESRSLALLVQAGDLGAVVRWEDADAIELDPRDLDTRPEAEALFAPVPPELNSPRELKKLARDFADYLYHEQRYELYYNPSLDVYSEPGESQRDFAARAQQLARERRDAEVDKLREKYRRQIHRLETRLEREERELAEDEAQYKARMTEELISGAETVVGLLGIFGRRRTSGLSRAATKRRLTAQAKADIEESKEEIARLQEEIQDLQDALQEEIDAITEKWADALDRIEVYEVKPRRADVDVQTVALAWLPYWEIAYRADGGRPAHDRIPAW